MLTPLCATASLYLLCYTKLKMLVILVLLAACFTGGLCALASPELVHESHSPHFRIRVGDDDWFRSGAVTVHSEGVWWSSTNKDANILKSASQKSFTGRDTFGNYQAESIEWDGYKNPSTADSKVKVQTISYMYPDITDLFVFEIVYVSGLTSAAIANTTDQTISTYPSFVIEENNMQRGWLTWHGNMAKTSATGVWAHDDVYGGLDGGFPLVVFDKAMSKAVVLSPLNTFMSVNQMSFTDQNTKEKLLTFGPLSTIDTVPAGYSFKSVVVYGKSVLNVMDRFGELMRGYYGKEDNFRKSDFSINYLGYWTDNGACYYYNTSSKYSDYEELLTAVKKDADESAIPYRYMQLDSWWYYRGSNGGVTQWTPRPDIFPDGIEPVVQATGWRVVAHNRFWAPETDYAKDYKFIVEKDIALPVDPKFWDFLISSSQLKWNLMVYEQDWLDYQYPRTMALLTDLGLGEMWLKQMGEAAMRYGITIQYCMPWTRHILQSLAIPVVTQIRVSDDYQPGNSQWEIGDTTILAHAVGLAAFKDNFRTSTDQPDCKHYGHMTEEYPALETYTAALSGGPVGPSDQIGKANQTLINATCMPDGRLLKPSYPVMSIDNTFLQRAFGSGGPDGQLWAAITVIDRHSWHLVLAADLASDYTLTPKDLSPVYSIDQLIIAYQYSISTGNVTKIMLPFLKDNILVISKCGRSDFQYWAIITAVSALPNGRYLLGELDKIVPVSEMRFSNFDSGCVRVSGVVGEMVRVSVFDLVKNEVTTVKCIISEDGSSTLHMGSSGDPPPYCS